MTGAGMNAAGMNAAGMNGACPDTLILRIFAEGELDEDRDRVTQHVARCEACRLVVERARREEAVLREQLGTLEMPPSLHAATLRALDQVTASSAAAQPAAPASPSSKKRPSPGRVRTGRGGRDKSSQGASRRGPLLVQLGFSVLLLGAAGLAMYFAFRPSTPQPQPQTPGSGTPGSETPGSGTPGSETPGSETSRPATPAPPPVVAPAPPPAPSPTAPPAPPEDPGPIVKGPDKAPPITTPPVTPEPVTPPPPVTAPPSPVTPPPAPVTPPKTPETPRGPDEKPAPSPPSQVPSPTAPPAPRTPQTRPDTREELALAVVRSGKLTVAGRTLAIGEMLPEGETVEVGSSLTELESADTAKLVVASGTRLSVTKGEGGKPVFHVTSGKLLASSAGARSYSVTSADARTTPHGNSFMVVVELGKTRVSALEGRLRVDVERGPADGAPLEVRPGFEAEVVKGKNPEAPRPFVHARAVGWLPEAARPKAAQSPPRIVRAFGFEDGESFTQGAIVLGGAHGSKHALKGVAGDDRSSVELSDDRASALELDGDLWVEVHCRVSKAATVSVEVGPQKRRPERGPRGPERNGPERNGPERNGPERNGDDTPFELRTKVEAGRWVTIVAPLKDFVAAGQRGPGPGPGGPNGPVPGRPWPRRPKDAGPEKLGRFTIVASAKGEAVELLVDDVRFYRYDE